MDSHVHISCLVKCILQPDISCVVDPNCMCGDKPANSFD